MPSWGMLRGYMRGTLGFDPTIDILLAGSSQVSDNIGLDSAMFAAEYNRIVNVTWIVRDKDAVDPHEARAVWAGDAGYGNLESSSMIAGDLARLSVIHSHL